MAYQNVGVPRFYIDHGLWLYSSEEFIPPADQISLFQLNPSNVVVRPVDTIQIPRVCPMRYCAFLGHKGNAAFYNDWSDGTTWAGAWYSGYEEIINAPAPSVANGVLPDYSGFSISTFDDNATHPYLRAIINYANAPAGSPLPTIGAVSMGNFYDMPNAPNLSLTMSREYGGTKEFTTHNGSSMSNTMWSKPAQWGDLPAWALSEGGGFSSSDVWNMAASGRRSWDLKFSYMADSDVFPMFSTLGAEESWHASGDDFWDWFNTWHIGETILDSDNFYSQVWHKTLGGTLPFIFQPDNSNNNPDQFCIAKFKDNSLKATQSAHNVYDISLSIEEVW
jgi:hypothetical protein